MCKTFIIFILAFFFMQVKAGQSSITIINSKCPDGIALSFGRSVDNNPAHFINAADFFIFQNHKATKHFEWDNPVFLMITGNEYCPKQRIILCPNDSIVIYITEEGILHFEGTNSEGNNKLREHNLLASGALRIEKELESASSKDDLISLLEKRKNELFAPLQELYKEGVISDDFYEFSRKEFELVFCHAVQGKLYISSLSEEDKLQILCHFYTLYNPFDSQYENNYMKLSNMANMAKLMDAGKIEKSVITHTGLWNDAQRYKEYMPVDCQEADFANGLQIRRNIMGIESDSQYKSCIELLRRLFPLSVYLPVLEMYSKDLHNSDNAFGLFVYNSMNGLSRLSRHPSMDLQEVVKSQFKGKPVFVDLWATYCAPCKKEFLHSREVEKFLASKDIRMLYVSVDYPNNSQKWEGDIAKYHLNGYHYFITNGAGRKISLLLGGESVTIPRYFIIRFRWASIV